MEEAMMVDLSNITTLHTTATQGHFKIVKFLLEACSRLAKIARNNGKTPIHYASKYKFKQEPPDKPTSGSLFFSNKRVLRFFRKDGHSWRKNHVGRNLDEAHGRLQDEDDG